MNLALTVKMCLIAMLLKLLLTIETAEQLLPLHNLHGSFEGASRSFIEPPIRLVYASSAA